MNKLTSTIKLAKCKLCEGLCMENMLDERRICKRCRKIAIKHLFGLKLDQSYEDFLDELLVMKELTGHLPGYTYSQEIVGKDINLIIK